jgi:hypothetical protein
VLVAGTNDLSEVKENTTNSNIISNFTKLLETAKNKAEAVCVSSICPRLDRDAPLETLETLNANIQVLCEEKECSFIDSTASFILNDGSINDGYLIAGKGPTLSAGGTNKLARNLKLQLTNPSSNVAKTTSSRKHGNGPPSQRNERSSQRNERPIHRNRSHERSPLRNRSHERPSYQNRSHDRPDRNERPYLPDQSVIHFNTRGCYYCNENGHNSENCRHQGPVSCHSCGQRGHKSKHHMDNVY